MIRPMIDGPQPRLHHDATIPKTVSRLVIAMKLTNIAEAWLNGTIEDAGQLALLLRLVTADIENQ